MIPVVCCPEEPSTPVSDVVTVSRPGGIGAWRSSESAGRHAERQVVNALFKTAVLYSCSFFAGRFSTLGVNSAGEKEGKIGEWAENVNDSGFFS
jgi:hypothetical protein